MKRVGVLGGSFDPVHYGHLCLAQDARDLAGLDEVILMPAKLQPFKLDKRLTEPADRLTMLKIAAMRLENISVSSRELDSDRISYTATTLDELRQELDDGDKLYFITGTDSFIALGTWYRADEILAHNGIVVGIRPGYREDEVEQKSALYRTAFGTEVMIIENRRLDISSTEIRERVRKGESTEGLLPQEVRDYIDEHGIYK
ncbi:MAG: nicotinate-nucleotide adenylyltransferase [Eubacteriaceae bacterium]|nr:nicotinate-nucleotide adenylyltransferase [Eubacteriaceae bacterium]